MESELRTLSRDRADLKEEVLQLKNKQKQTNAQILDQISETTKIK